MGGLIYINEKIAEHFNLSNPMVDNTGKKFITHCQPLYKQYKENGVLDEHHNKVLEINKNKTVCLVGVGYGWWQIEHAV